MPSLFEHAGGDEAIHRLEDIFYRSVLADQVLKPLFGEGQRQHVDHLPAFTANPSAARTAPRGSLASAT